MIDKEKLSAIKKVKLQYKNSCEEDMDEQMRLLYSDEETVSRYRGYRSELRQQGRVGTLFDNNCVSFKHRWISRHGAKRILADGVEESLQRRTNFEEELTIAKQILYEEPLRLPLDFVTLEHIFGIENSRIYNNNVTHDISLNDGFYGFDPDDKYIAFKQFISWCTISGRPLQKWYRGLFLPELPNWPYWDVKSSFTLNEAAHLLTNSEPGSHERSERLFCKKEFEAVLTEFSEVSMLITAAAADGTLYVSDDGFVKMDAAARYLISLERIVPEHIGQNIKPVEVDAPNSLGSEPEYSIEYLGASYEVRFQGVRFTIKPTLGMKYLVIMIQNSGHRFTGYELIAAFAGRGVEHDNDDYIEEVDQRSIDDVKRNLEERKQCFAETTNLAERIEIEDEIEKLGAWLSTVCAESGAPRKVSVRNKRANDAVRVRIKRTLAEIKTIHKPFHSHLGNEMNMSFGGSNRYAPNSPVDWQIITRARSR